MHTGRCLAAVSMLLLAAGCFEERAAPDPAPVAATTPADPIDPAPTTTAPADPTGADPGPPSPPVDRATSPSDDPRVAEFLGYTAPKPAVWLWHPPETRMRAANYVVPARSGADQAHVVVFHGIGGGKDANIARWRGQFRDTEHGPVDAHITELEANGVPITMVELQGERMKMGDGWYTPNQLLLAAIVHDPRGDLHIMFQGQYETVHANRDVFMRFVEGLERRDDG